MGPDSSDLAQNLPPGLIFHEDSESGLKMGGFRGKNSDFGQKLAMELAMVGVLSPPHFWGDGAGGYFLAQRLPCRHHGFTITPVHAITMAYAAAVGAITMACLHIGLEETRAGGVKCEVPQMCLHFAEPKHAVHEGSVPRMRDQECAQLLAKGSSRGQCPRRPTHKAHQIKTAVAIRDRQTHDAG